MGGNSTSGTSLDGLYNQLMSGDLTGLAAGTYTLKDGSVSYSTDLPGSGAKYGIVLEEVLVTATSPTTTPSSEYHPTNPYSYGGDTTTPTTPMQQELPELNSTLTGLVSALGLAGNHLEINNTLLGNAQFSGILGKGLGTVNFLGFVGDAYELYRDPNLVDAAQVVTWGIGYFSKDPRVKMAAGVASILLEIYELDQDNNSTTPN